MAIQIRGVQIQDESIESGKINLSGSFDYRAASSFIATTQAEATNDTKIATTAFVHTLVSSSAGDGFQGGDGININTATSPDTIAVDLATNPGLQFTSNALDLKLEANKGLSKGANGLAVVLKSESGGTISVDSSGLFINDSAISNAKLANSTISGVALGSNLNSLSKATNGGVQLSSYNGSSAVSDITLDINDLAAAAVNVANDSIAIYDADADTTGKEAIADLATAQAGNGIAATSGVFAVDADGSTLTVGASGVKVSDGGIGATQLASSAVATAKVADNAITAPKLGFEARQDVFAPNGIVTGKLLHRMHQL